MTMTSRTDCVVDAHGANVIIWHVNTGSDLGMPRMTGAWTITSDDQEIIQLLIERRRVLTTQDGHNALNAAGIGSHERIDVTATTTNLSTERDALQAMYDKHPKRKTLVAPDWPRLPSDIDSESVTVSPDCPTQRALSLARWLESVAASWDRIEAERLLRRYMPGVRRRRPTPLAVRPGTDQRHGGSEV